MNIISRLLEIAKQKSIHIMALFFTTGLILILLGYSFQKINDILFLDSIPADSVGWIISIVFIFCGFLLILNLFVWCKHKIGGKIKIDPIGQKIAEIKKNETVINILCAIKILQDDYQENSEILGRPIPIPESEISKRSGVSLGFTQLWIGKLNKVGFLIEGFGEVYGVKKSPGLEFLRKIGRLK